MIYLQSLLLIQTKEVMTSFAKFFLLISKVSTVHMNSYQLIIHRDYKWKDALSYVVVIECKKYLYGATIHLVLMAKERTWEKQGSKDIKIVGLEDK